MADKSKRRWLIPEVIQTSAMDCGPAALKSILEGFGRPVSYGRLREACHTEVDGTSIDTIEEIAQQLGLNAAQVMLPVDHVVHPAAAALPCLAIVKLEGGNHFVVVWRRHGAWLQVMDPGTGRRWTPVKSFLDQLYRHEQEIPADAWEEWARGPGLVDPLRARMKAINAPSALLDHALAAPGWQKLAALDAAIFLAKSLNEPSLAALANQPDLIPNEFWRALPGDEPGTVKFRGAVLLQCEGLRETNLDELPQALRASLAEKPPRPIRELAAIVREDGWGLPFAAALAACTAAGAVLIESLLLRGLFNLSPHLPRVAERAGATAILVAFLVAVLFIEWAMEGMSRTAGRRLEQRLRARFCFKIPRLGDRYFQSRLISDMAQRAHAVQLLRGVPALAANLLRTAGSLLATIAGIIWFFPAATLPALLCAATGVLLPVFAQKILTERDHRFREYAGSLTRFYLDALMGIVPIRTHGAAPALRNSQGNQLGNWARAGLRTQSATVALTTLQLALGYGLSAWLVFSAMRAAANPAALLLLIYWALSLPELGRAVASTIWLWPGLRNALLRLLEPLGAPEETLTDSNPITTTQSGGIGIQMTDLHVAVGGHPILSGINLQINPGEHIGIVGPSGAGKSSLVGLLLGWYRPTAGTLEIDGQPATDSAILALRRQTAWVDPQIQLWNEPLLDNLRYGLTDETPLEAGRVIEQANLSRVIQNLPAGLQSKLGEGGAQLSGGEGQRVRMGRACGKPGVRLTILDEPTRGLDRGQRDSFLQRAREIWQDATLLCITHDVASTRAFSRVLVIDHGQVVEDGDPAQLHANPDSRYRQLCDREEQVRKGLWSAALWRRFAMRDGALSEDVA